MFRLQARKVCITPPRPGFPQVASVPAWLYAALPGDDGEHDDAHFLPWTGPLGQLVSLLVPQLNKTLPLLTALPPADLGLRISWALRTGRQSALQPRWLPTPQASRLYLREMFVEGYTGGVIPNGRLHAGRCHDPSTDPVTAKPGGLFTWANGHLLPNSHPQHRQPSI